MIKPINNVIIERAVVDEDQLVEGPIKRVFHSGIPCDTDDVQIMVASKKRFMEWYRNHTPSYPIRNHKGVVDAGKVIRMDPDGSFNIVGVTFAVHDDDCEEFPFKMNFCDSFTVEMPELHCLKNLPRTVKSSAQYGSGIRPMQYMDTLVGGVVKAQSVTVHTLSTFLNLETSLQGTIEHLAIYAPYFASFEGLNVPVNYLSLTGWNQTSFKGIHRALENVDIKSLLIGVSEKFDGGILPFAMMREEIEIVPDIAANPSPDFIDAMGIVNAARKEDHANVHDIQERLIDAGFGKYARL